MSSADPLLSGATTPPECYGPRRSWLIPLAVVGTLLAVAVSWWVLMWVGILSVPPFVTPFPPYWIFFPIGFLFLWFFVFLLVRRGGGWGGQRWGAWRTELDAEEVVRIRYARGEITREELLRRLTDLRESSPDGSHHRVR